MARRQRVRGGLKIGLLLFPCVDLGGLDAGAGETDVGFGAELPQAVFHLCQQGLRVVQGLTDSFNL